MRSTAAGALLRSWAVPLVGVGIAVHFSLVLLSLVPGDWLPPMARRAAAAYVSPLFRQNWWLFAPEPARVHREAWVRGMGIEGGRSRTTPWVSLTAATTDAVRAGRLSPANGTWITVLNATYSLTEGAPFRLRGAARDLLLRAWSTPARQPAGLVVLGRAGSAFLRARFPAVRLAQVQLRVSVAPLAGGPPDAIEFPPVPFADGLPAWPAPP